MDDWRWIVWLIGIVVLLRLSPALMMIPTLLRLRLRPFRAVQVDPQDLDPEVVDRLRETAEPLVSLGFEPAGFTRTRGVIHAGADWETSFLLVHAETGTYAEIVSAGSPDYRLPWRIDLVTALEGDRRLLTLNAMGHEIVGALSSTVVQDVSCMTELELWEAHRQKLSELGTPERIGLAEVLSRGEHDSNRLLAQFMRDGWIWREGEGPRFHFRLRAVLRLAWKVGMGAARRERFLAQRAGVIARGEVAAHPVPLWEEVQAYLRVRRLRRRSIPRSAQAALLIGSAILFAAAMSLVFGAVGAVCLLGVMALHEFGHYAAMRLLGYADTSVFFVPFLGAAATGRKRDATLSQEMVVLMAGPVPGIALGVALSFLRPDLLASEAGFQLVAMLIGINVLNLLPVMPLDGGKIVERVLLGGRPWASLLVGAAGVAGFAGLAIWAGDPILLVFCILFAVGQRAHFRGLRLLERVRASAPSAGGEAERARATFAVLADDPPRPFARKVGLVQLVDAHWVLVPASRLARAAWSFGYAAALFLAVAGGGLAIATARPGQEEAAPGLAAMREHLLVHPGHGPEGRQLHS